MHYTFDDKSEMAEEYDASSGELLSKLNSCQFYHRNSLSYHIIANLMNTHTHTHLIAVRKWRRKSTLGAVLPWEFEVGQNHETKNNASVDMFESSSNV